MGVFASVATLAQEGWPRLQSAKYATSRLILIRTDQNPDQIRVQVRQKSDM